MVGAETDASRSTRAVAEGWFEALTAGNLDRALSFMAPDVEFICHAKVPGVNDVMAWIGTYHGRDAVREAFGVFASLCVVQREELLGLVVEGTEAMGVIHEIGLAKATGVGYETEFIQRLSVVDGQIVRWRSYDDPSTIISALRGIAA